MMNQMLDKCLVPIVFFMVITAVAPAHALETNGAPLNGQPGASLQGDSGWIGPDSPKARIKGHMTQLRLGGSALAKDRFPGSADGLICGLAVLPKGAPANASETMGTPLKGQLDASPQWGSGWINLKSPIALMKGDVLQLKLGGSAQKVVVRCLSKGESPDAAEGFISGIVVLPKDRIINIRLASSHSNVVQISVHGGPDPWGLYPLGQFNGPATLESARLVRY